MNYKLTMLDCRPDSGEKSVLVCLITWQLVTSNISVNHYGSSLLSSWALLQGTYTKTKKK